MSRRSSTPSLSTPSASLPPCVFSCRIVSIESYTCPPSKDLDICYSDFRSCPVEKVPVIRIFGATPLGQKTCLHIHGVFPYLYVPCMVDDPGAEYLQLVARSIYHALQVSLGPSSRNANHVFRIILTKGKPFYGYHEKNRLFLKIFLYNPALIKRLADLLVAGVVMNQVLQPHEAHIPFILQFMIDHHLFGMNHVHLANVRFRIGGCERASSGRRVSSRSSTPGPTPLSPQSPLSSSFLYNPSQTHWNVDTLPRDKIVCVPRASVCELEVDAIGAEILNRHELSLVSEGYPGLAALWEEEKQRRSGLGMDTSLSPPPSPGRCEDADGYHGTEKRLQEDLAEIIQQRLHPRDATPFDDSVLDPSLNSGSSKDSHLPAMSTVGKETVVVNSQALLQTQSLSQRCSVEAIEQCSDEDIFELLMEFCQSPSYSQPATHPLLSQPSTPSLSSQPSQPPEPPLSSQPSQPPAPLLSSQSFPASSQELNPPHSPQTVGKMLLDSMRRSRSVKSASSLFSSPSPPASQSNRLSVRDPLLTQVPVNSKIDTGDRDELNVEVMDTSATADAAESRVDPASTRHLFPVYATHLSESSLLDESLASDAPNENSLEDSVLASDTGAEEEEEELPNVLVPNSEAVGTAAGQDDQSNFLKPTLTSLIPVARDISTELRNLDSVGPDLERAMVSPLRTPSPKPQEMDDCVSERVSPFDEEVWMEGVGDSLPCAQPQLSALDSRTGALWGAEQEWNQSVAGVLSGFKPEPEGGGVQLEYSISEADMAQFDHSGTSAGPGSMLSGLSQAPGTASEKGDGARESGSHHLTRRCLLKLVLGEESGDEEGVAWSDDSLEEEHAEMTQLVWDDELCSPVSDLKCGQRTGSLRDRPSTVRSDVISQLDGSGDSPPHGGIVATTPGKKRRKRRKTLGMAKKRRTNPSLTKLTVVHGEITPVSGRELHREATPSCRREAPRDITPLSMPMEETPPPATCPEEAKTDPVVHPVQTTQDKEALIVRYATNLISPPNPGKRSLSRLNLASSKRKHKHSLSLRKRQQRTGRIPLLALEKRTCRVSLVKLDLTTLNIPHCRRLQNESGHQQAQNDSASDRQLEPDDWSQARRFESSAQSPDSSQPKTKGRTHQLAVLQNTLQQQRQLSELSSSQQSVCWKRQRQRNASVPPIESSQQCMQTCKSMGRPHKSSVPPTEGPSQYMHALQPRGRLRKSSIPRMEDNKQHIVSWSRSPQQRTRQSGTRRRSKSWIDTSEVVPLLDHDPLAMSTKDDEARLNLALKISAAESELFSPRPKQSAEPFSPAAAIETSSPQAEAELFSPRPEAAAIEMPSSLSGAKLLLEHPSPQSGDSTPPLSPQKLPNTNSDRAIAINTTPPQSEVNLDYSITSIEETPPRTPPLRVNTPPLKSAPPTHVPSSIPRRLFEFNEGLHSRTESLSFKGPYGNTGTAFRHNDKACCNEAVLLSAHGRVHIESPCKELPSDDGTTSEEDMAAMRKNHDDSFSLYFSSCESDTGSEVEGEREISPLNMSEPIKIRQIRYLRSIAAEEKLDMVSIQKREVWTPSVLPLSPQEALESALRYGIPPAVHVKPYYSNPADVQSARCVGGRILKVSSMMPYELNEFEAPYLDADTKPFSLLGLHQLNSVESLLPPCHNANKHNQFGDYVQAINARSRLFSDGGVVITPAAPPPCPAKLAGSVQPGDSDATPSRADHSPAQDLTTSVAQCKGTPQHCGPNPRNIGATLVSTSDKATPIPEFGQELAPLESGQTTPTAELEEDIATSVPGLAHSTPMKKEPCVAEDKGGDLEVKGGLLLNMSLLKRETSQLEGPTPANSFGFKVSQSALQRSHDLHEVQHLTSLSVELHVHTRGSFKPDPELDPVLAIFYFIHCDWPLPDGGAGPNTRLGIIAINKSYDLFSGRGNTTHTKSAAEAMPTGESALVAATATPTGKSLMPGTGSVTPTKESCDPTPEYCGGYLGGCGLPAGVMVEYVSSEQELLRSLVQLVREEDPDFLIGYEVVMSSWGYLIDRAAALNVNLINEISRVPSELPESQLGNVDSAQHAVIFPSQQFLQITPAQVAS